MWSVGPPWSCRCRAMTVSVVIPTVRQRFLAAALGSLERANTRGAVRVLVVENGVRDAKTDRSSPTRRRRARVGVEMRYHFLETAGATPRATADGARPAARSSRSPTTMRDGRWLIGAVLRAHHEFPAAACIGGAVDLDFLAAPARLADVAVSPDARRHRWPPEDADQGGPTTDITDVSDRYLVSANLSFRKSVFESIGGFWRTWRDPIASRNDEALFSTGPPDRPPGPALRSAMRVRHQIPAERLTPDYFERKFRALAASTYEYHRRVSEYAGVPPPFAPTPRRSTTRFCNTRWRPASRAADRRSPDGRCRTRRHAEFILQLLRCKVAWFEALHACIRTVSVESTSLRLRIAVCLGALFWLSAAARSFSRPSARGRRTRLPQPCRRRGALTRAHAPRLPPRSATSRLSTWTRGAAPRSGRSSSNASRTLAVRHHPSFRRGRYRIDEQS